MTRMNHLLVFPLSGSSLLGGNIFIWTKSWQKVQFANSPPLNWYLFQVPAEKKPRTETPPILAKGCHHSTSHETKALSCLQPLCTKPIANQDTSQQRILWPFQKLFDCVSYEKVAAGRGSWEKYIAFGKPMTSFLR